MALAKIAEKHKYDGLADIFRAPTIAWRLVARLKEDIGDEPQHHRMADG
jgi:hypothetical protein